MILSLLLRISKICSLRTPYSVDKLVPFTNYRIIDSIFHGKNGSLTFRVHDEFVLTYKQI